MGTLGRVIYFLPFLSGYQAGGSDSDNGWWAYLIEKRMDLMGLLLS